MSFQGSIRALLFIAAIALFGQHALAQSVWSGGASSEDWNAPSNWANMQIPPAGAQIQIPAGISVYPTIDTNVGNFQSLVVASGAQLRIDPSGVIGFTNAVSVSGILRVQGGTFTHTGTALNSRCAVAGPNGQINVTSGTMSVGSFGNNGVVTNNGRLVIGAGSTLTFTGNVVDFQINNFSLTNSGTLQFDATGTSMSVSLPSSATLLGNVQASAASGLDSVTFSGPCSIANLTMSGGGDIQFNNTVSISGNLNDSGTGACNFAQTVTFNGSGATAQNVTITARTINMQKFWVSTNGTLIFDGDVSTTSAGTGIQAAVRVASPSTLEMRGDSSITLAPTIGVPTVDIYGTFTTAGAFNNRPSISGGAAAASYGVMQLQNGSSVAINGLLLERFGPPTSAYAMGFGTNASISLLDFVSIPNCESSDSVIQLNTSNLPLRFVGIELDGSCPFNIDARQALLLNAPVELTPGQNAGGALFGDNFEQDPSGVLDWVIPPALSIDSPSPLNPANAGQLYLPPALMASGGTGGYTWSATGLPGWLTLTPGSGQLSGTPTAMDVGRASFTIDLDDGFTQISKAFELDVFAPGAGPVQIATNALSDATEGLTYSQVIQGQNGVPPYNWTVQNLPMGLMANTTGGGGAGQMEILGTPEFGTEGPYPVTIRVQDQVGVSDMKTLTLQVNRQVLVGAPVALGSNKCSLSAGNTANWIVMLVLLAGAGVVIRMRRRADA